MEQALLFAKDMLQKEGFTCVLCRGDQIVTSHHRGVRPLMDCLDSGRDFSGFFAADKVVGRATAFLYCLLGVRQIYAQVLSKGAQQVLEEYGIPCFYDCLVPGIRNRNDTGPCPMEAATSNSTTPREALVAIRNKRKQMLEGK